MEMHVKVYHGPLFCVGSSAGTGIHFVLVLQENYTFVVFCVVMLFVWICVYCLDNFVNPQRYANMQYVANFIITSGVSRSIKHTCTCILTAGTHSHRDNVP